MKINPDFIKMTDQLIGELQRKKFIAGNGNVLLAKPPVEEVTKGGIILAEDFKELEQKRAGFAKVISVPNNLNPEEGDIPVKPGDYIFFTYVADNPIYYKAIAEITGVSIPKETLFYTSDSEIIAVLPKEEVEC